MNTVKSDNFGGLRFLLLNEVFMLSHVIIVKILGMDFAPVQIVFIRCLSSAVLLVPLLAWWGDIDNVRTQLGLNTLRVLLSSAAITLIFFAISQMQLAQLSTIGYLRPAVTSIIAYIFLREAQAWHRWIVIVIGFASMFFIFSTEDSQLQLIAVFTFFGMCFGSSATILQKFLSRKMKDLPLMVWYSVGVALVTAPFAIWAWEVPSERELCLMIMTGLLATTAQFFFIRAFRKADASFLAPMFYFHIVPTALIGFLIFDETPTINTILGAFIILVSLVLMALVERWKSKAYGPL